MHTTHACLPRNPEGVERSGSLALQVTCAALSRRRQPVVGEYLVQHDTEIRRDVEHVSSLHDGYANTTVPHASYADCSSHTHPNAACDAVCCGPTQHSYTRGPLHV